MDHARQRGMVVFTHDLDSETSSPLRMPVDPSVIQVRTEDPVPSVIGERSLVSSIREYEAHLDRGAL